MNDIINGAFESLGLFFILPSIFKVYHDKRVQGISAIHVGFFTVWGYWNLWYYPSLNQWISCYGGIGIALANTVFFAQLIYYSRKKK